MGHRWRGAEGAAGIEPCGELQGTVALARTGKHGGLLANKNELSGAPRFLKKRKGKRRGHRESGNKIRDSGRYLA